MQVWKHLEKEQIIATVRMSRPNLLKYVEGKLGTSKKQQVGPRSRMVKVGA